MHSLSRFFRDNLKTILLLGGIAALSGVLNLYKLGSLTHGLSATEVSNDAPYGWNGLVHHPLYAPYQLVRSALFLVIPHHGATISRLTSSLFVILAVLALTRLMQLWYGDRAALLTGLLFATSAWTLHVGRYNSPDAIYLAVIPLLLLSCSGIRNAEKPYILPVVGLLWTGLLFVPGVVWLIVLQFVWQRGIIRSLWNQLGSWKLRLLSVAAPVLLVTPLLIHLATNIGDLKRWAGLPTQFSNVPHSLKLIAAVPVHLFVRGPLQPETWLGMLPILDIASLVFCAIGIYFYAKRYKANRSQILALNLVVGGLLVGLHGAVSLSLVVPMLFMFIGGGIASLLHDWLKVFPNNPFARTAGIALVCMAVTISCVYNVRAYFVAWPHNAATEARFVILERPKERL